MFQVMQDQKLAQFFEVGKAEPVGCGNDFVDVARFADLGLPSFAQALGAQRCIGPAELHDHVDPAGPAKRRIQFGQPGVGGEQIDVPRRVVTPSSSPKNVL